MRTVAEDSADQRNFQGCAWATRALQKAAIEQVRDMLDALTLGRTISIRQQDRPASGIPYVPHTEWVVSVDEWFVTAETKEEAECKMLGLILRDGIGWPLLRGCKPNHGFQGTPGTAYPAKPCSKSESENGGIQ